MYTGLALVILNLIRYRITVEVRLSEFSFHLLGTKTWHFQRILVLLCGSNLSLFPMQMSFYLVQFSNQILIEYSTRRLIFWMCFDFQFHFRKWSYNFGIEMCGTIFSSFLQLRLLSNNNQHVLPFISYFFKGKKSSWKCQ